VARVKVYHIIHLAEKNKTNYLKHAVLLYSSFSPKLEEGGKTYFCVHKNNQATFPKHYYDYQKGNKTI
jgi:hypothetical protein